MEFKQSMPIITSLRNPSLKQRHWDEIERMIGKSIVKDRTFTLGNLLEMKVRFILYVFYRTFSNFFESMNILYVCTLAH